MHSLDSAGSTTISGTLGGGWPLSLEFDLDRPALASTAAKAVLCFFRKLPAVSEDIRGVLGREGSGLTTRSCAGPTDSLKPSPWPFANGLAQCVVFMRMMWWSSSTVTGVSCGI